MAVDLRLAVQGIVALATALLYAYVARLVLARQLPPEAHRANVAFATWWWAIGLVQFLSGAYSIPAAFGLRDLALVVTLLNLLMALITLALGALVYFLVYLYTGSQRALWPVAIGYGLLGLLLLYAVAWMQPIGFDEAKGAGELAFRHELTGAPAVALGLLFSGPVLVAAVGYGSLYFRTDAPVQRFRIAVVAGSFVAWFGWSTVSALLQLQQRFPRSLALLAVNSALSLAVPLVIVAAYRPPAWIRSRLEEAQRLAA